MKLVCIRIKKIKFEISKFYNNSRECVRGHTATSYKQAGANCFYAPPMKTCHVIIWLILPFLSSSLNFLSLSVSSELSLLASFFFFFFHIIKSIALPRTDPCINTVAMGIESESKKRAKKTSMSISKSKNF